MLAPLLGAAAAGMLGVLFLYADGGDGIVYVDGPSITVSSDSPVYGTGEPVVIRVTNSGTVPLLSSDSYSMEIRGLDTVLIYSMPGRGGSVLEPDQSALITWNQTRSDGTQVLHGVYKIHVRAAAPDGAEVADGASIQILG